MKKQTVGCCCLMSKWMQTGFQRGPASAFVLPHNSSLLDWNLRQLKTIACRDFPNQYPIESSLSIFAHNQYIPSILSSLQLEVAVHFWWCKVWQHDNWCNSHPGSLATHILPIHPSTRHSMTFSIWDIFKQNISLILKQKMQLFLPQPETLPAIERNIQG